MAAGLQAALLPKISVSCECKTHTHAPSMYLSQDRERQLKSVNAIMTTDDISDRRSPVVP